MKTKGFAVLVFLFSISNFSYPQMPNALIQSINESVFELVVERSEVDTLIYDEPFPYDLLPYQERNDKYISLGTAFPVGDGRFITAAHVFALHKKSFHGNFFIRSSSRKLFPVKDIISFSSNRDYAVFTAHGIEAPGLELSEDYLLNSRVYACGNALGQGIILRDGLLTSTTKESKSGEWEWLRFSAAASPGNSGGPLLNEQGQVIGLITMKSENENLNYALPVSEWDLNGTGSIDLHLEYSYTLPNFLKKAYNTHQEQFPGPVSIEYLHDYFSSLLLKLYKQSADEIYYSRKEPVFPGAEMPGTYEPFNTFFPVVSYEKSVNTWHFGRPENIIKTETKNGAYLQLGSMLNFVHFYYKKTGDETVDRFFSNPEDMIERVLEGFRLVRNAGKKEVRIKSFSTHSNTQWHEDRLGRSWLIVEWDVPSLNFTQLGFFLPVPDGFIGFTRGMPYADKPVYTMDGKVLCDFILMGYSGSFEDWKLYLSNDRHRSGSLQGIRVSENAGHGILVSTENFSFTINEDTPGYGNSSIMNINTWWYPQNGTLKPGIYSLGVTNGINSDAFTFLQKWPKPGTQASEETIKKWNTIRDGKFPYNMSPHFSDNNAYVTNILNIDPGADPNFIYIFNTCIPGTTQPVDAKFIFGLAAAKLKMSPQEITAGKMKMQTGEPEIIDGFTIFKAISANRQDIFNQFLINRIDIEAINDAKDTPLIFSIKTNNPEYAEKLLALPINLDQRDNEGNTALVLALQLKQIDLARLLIERGADVNLQAPSGIGPLVLSMDKSYGNLPDLILESGADPGMKSNSLAVSMALMQQRNDLAIKLAEKDFPVNEKDMEGRTSLIYAINNMDEPMAIFLINKGASINDKMDGGFTPLYESLRRKLSSVSSYLIRSNCDINYSIEGWTPLLLAAHNGFDNEVINLINRGADITARTLQGNTVLHYTVQNCSNTTVQFILNNGGKVLLDSKNNEGKKPMDMNAQIQR